MLSLVEENSPIQQFAVWILYALGLVVLLIILWMILRTIGEFVGERLRAAPGFVQQNRGVIMVWLVGSLLIDLVLVAIGLNVVLSIVMGLAAFVVVVLLRSKDGKL